MITLSDSTDQHKAEVMYRQGSEVGPLDVAVLRCPAATSGCKELTASSPHVGVYTNVYQQLVLFQEHFQHTMNEGKFFILSFLHTFFQSL